MKYIVAVISLLLVGCTTVRVDQVDVSHNIDHVCIERNPKVIVKEFLPVIENIINRHHIGTEVFEGDRPSHCEFRMTYIARREWDFAFYLSYAVLRLYHNEDEIGYAQYELNGIGGFGLNKWASVESKMEPIVDRLLIQYKTSVKK